MGVWVLEDNGNVRGAVGGRGGNSPEEGRVAFIADSLHAYDPALDSSHDSIDKSLITATPDRRHAQIDLHPVEPSKLHPGGRWGGGCGQWTNGCDQRASRCCRPPTNTSRVGLGLVFMNVCM